MVVVASNVESQEPIVEADESSNLDKQHLIWKKNTPCLYDLILSHSLSWPSLSVEFFKDMQEEEGFNVYRLLVGTNTCRQEAEKLMICSLKLPTSTEKVDYNPETGEYGGYIGLSSSLGRLDTQISIIHDQEVNRARIMPQNQNIIATTSPSSKVYIFDIAKHPSTPASQTEIKEQICLSGHTKEGFSLSWNVHNEGNLLSGANDSLICFWDISAVNSNGKKDSSSDKFSMNPKSIFTFHTDVIEDVQWHFHNPHVFGSASDDKSIAIWDIRTGALPQIIKFDAHEGFVNCLAFHHSSDNFFLSGSSDTNIKLWDLRNLSDSLHSFDGTLKNSQQSSPDNSQSQEPNPKSEKKDQEQSIDLRYRKMKNSLHSFSQHKSEVYSLQWCPHNDALFMSGSLDRTVKIWDISLIGAEQTSQDAADGPPELLFVHGGHTERVSDISWHVADPYLAASVADDNILQVWKFTSDILNSDV
ncbi:MAG: hypothetical protein MHMPM18_001556 [Marteilia pararefringens]